VPDQVPAPQKGNIWVLPMATGEPVRLTAIDGKARSPAWDYDGKTLAFVTHDGQVGLVQVDQPGRIWRAAETSPDSALFTSAFFVP
jgi:Tol biopolymer transport system component